jgi:hypothetical protein
MEPAPPRWRGSLMRGERCHWLILSIEPPEVRTAGVGQFLAREG